MKTPDILLVAVNARYSHASYAIRSLRANLGALRDRSTLLETDLEITPIQLAERIAAQRSRVVGFSIYLWNRPLIEATARILRHSNPSLILIAGGPELTPGYPSGADVQGLWDTVIIGEGESAFRTCCSHFLDDGTFSETSSEILAKPENLSELALPYDEYTEEDITQRTIYAETSRGCPCSCTYCTSDSTTFRLFPLDPLLASFESLWKRGVRQFKFLDRTFNASVRHACAVLNFFLPRVTPDTCLHFEINPSHLHEELLTRMAAFPKGALHLEVGMQTLNPEVSQRIGRKGDPAIALENLRKLCHETGAIVHADLIFGLPGEDEASFAKGFDTLVATSGAPEVQVNWLKGLPGTRLFHEAGQQRLAFNPEPPYELIHSDVLSFDDLCRIQRFARCWELVHNRGKFPEEVRALHAAISPHYYQGYMALMEHIYATEGKFYAIKPAKLQAYLHEHLACLSLKFINHRELRGTEENG